MKNKEINKILIVICGLILALPSLATEIKFYRNAETDDNSLILPSLWGIEQSVDPEPVLEIPKDSIVDVEIKHDDESKRIIFQVNDDKASQLETITAGMIGKPLHFVFDGVVLMNPIVRSSLTGGRFLIDLSDNHRAFNHIIKELDLESILNKKADQDLDDSRNRSKIYIAIMTLTIAILLLYLFGSKLMTKS